MESRRDVSEFHGAFDYIHRLNNLFYSADQAAINQDIYMWWSVLLTLYRELSTEMKAKEDEQFQVDIAKINELVKDYTSVAQMGITDINMELFQSLQKFEKELRRIQKAAGLQQKIRDDPGSALM
jgi:hypothetical protein